MGNNQTQEEHPSEVLLQQTSQNSSLNKHRALQKIPQGQLRVNIKCYLYTGFSVLYWYYFFSDYSDICLAGFWKNNVIIFPSGFYEEEHDDLLST